MKYVLVTGACGGMGSAAVKAYKEAGYFVFAMDRRKYEAEERVMPLVADITNEDDIASAFEKVKEVTDNLEKYELGVALANLYA